MGSSSTDRIVIAPYVTSHTAGDFEHAGWNHVPVNDIRHYWSGEPAHLDRHAAAQVCWCDQSLSVRFTCTQREPLIVLENPITHQKTLRLWERDVCEIFLAPDRENPLRYFEFEAAPTGEWVDLGIVITPNGRETDWDYESGMIVSTQVGSDQFRIGMIIPWSRSIPKPKSGEEWRINLFRCVGPEEPARYLAWQPTGTPQPNFHVPEAFGWLHFK